MGWYARGHGPTHISGSFLGHASYPDHEIIFARSDRRLPNKEKITGNSEAAVQLPLARADN